MAQVIVTIPDLVAPRIVTAICANYGYQPILTNPVTGETEPNPVSAIQFVFLQRIKFLKDNLKQYEVPDLSKAERLTKIAEIDAIEITIQQVPPPQP